MNSDQVGGIVRALMAVGAGYALSLGFTDAQWLAITGAVVTLITIIWSVYSNTVTSMIASVARDKEVVKVVVSPALVFATGSPKVTTK